METIRSVLRNKRGWRQCVGDDEKGALREENEKCHEDCDGAEDATKRSLKTCVPETTDCNWNACIPLEI